MLTSLAASDLGKSYFASRYVQIVIYGFTIFRLGFTFVVACNCILLAAFNIATVIGVVLGREIFTDIWQALFFMIIVMLMSCKSSWSLEKHAKQDFLLKRLVDLERRRIQREQENVERLITDLFPRKVVAIIRKTPATSSDPPNFMADKHTNITVKKFH